jgi:predicted N-formylglutamate amidohydrolase
MAPSSTDLAPPVELINADSISPFLLVCDHASRALPAAYGTLGLEESELWRHIAWDIGAADVTRRLATALAAPAILSGSSRLLVDCNRATDDPTFICQVSDGTVIPGNRNLAPEEIRHRIRSYYEPYHQTITAEVARLSGQVAAPALVSIHSFTPVMRGVQRPWHVGILWDQDPRLAEPLLRLLGEDAALVVGDNQPYTARSTVGDTMQRHGAATGLPQVLIELRQDLVDTHHGAEAWADRLATVLRRLLAEHGPFAVERF